MPPGPHIVLTIHGIRTFGDWQRRLESAAKDAGLGLKFRHFQFGYFDTFSFLVPFLRERIVRRFEAEILHILEHEKPARLDIVGHSFGTYVIGRALQRLKDDSPVHVHTVILAGSVLRSDFDWLSLIPSRVNRLINDCGSADAALTFSQLFVLFTGRAGRVGFIGSNGSSFQNRYSEFGHSGYFEAPDGQPSNEYMIRNWLPVLSTYDEAVGFDHRRAPTALQGFNLWLTNNLEPVKILFYVAPFVTLSIILTALYIEASIRRDRVERVIGIARVMEERDELSLDAKRLMQMVDRTARRIRTHIHLLWIDDENSNAREIAVFEAFGLCTTRARTTDEAMAILAANPEKFAAIISDFRRDNDPKAGYGIIDEARKISRPPPIFFYVSSYTSEQARDAISRGANFQTNNPLELYREVSRSAAKGGEHAGRLALIRNRVFGCLF